MLEFECAELTKLNEDFSETIGMTLSSIDLELVKQGKPFPFEVASAFQKRLTDLGSTIKEDIQEALKYSLSGNFLINADDLEKIKNLKPREEFEKAR